jgi:formylglycine-generating enzyme required for sulfatase activity
MKLSFSIFLIVALNVAYGQSTFRGKVIDAKTKSPLSRATIKVKAQNVELSSGRDGTFELQDINGASDSIEVSHIGYKTVRKKLSELTSPMTIPMEDYSIQLRTVTITSRKLNLRQVDNSLRRIKDNLYAYETETTNGLYNLFVHSLREDDQHELLKLCDFDLSGYDERLKENYRNYSAVYKEPQNKKDTLIKDYTDYPAINVRHDAAILFCQWFTEQYNNNPGKKKFKKVKFRLPTLNEWQIAALGYPRFQSWTLDENMVEVVIPNDTISEIRQGKKTTIPVKEEILYPWWMAYNYRKKVQNSKNCFLGNFRILSTKNPCPAQIPGYDGWTKMSLTAAYFPNGMGLSDVVGNVAEMIDEEGKACGGSWNDPPSESTIRSVKSYSGPSDTVGFRLFMEVIEE